MSELLKRLRNDLKNEKNPTEKRPVRTIPTIVMKDRIIDPKTQTEQNNIDSSGNDSSKESKLSKESLKEPVKESTNKTLDDYPILLEFIKSKSNNFSVDKLQKKGPLFLRTAIREGRVDVVRALLELGVQTRNIVEPPIYTLCDTVYSRGKDPNIHAFVDSSTHLKLWNLLLEFGADVNETLDNHSCIHVTIKHILENFNRGPEEYYPGLELLNALIKSKADPLLRNTNKQVALQFALAILKEQEDIFTKGIAMGFSFNEGNNNLRVLDCRRRTIRNMVSMLVNAIPGLHPYHDKLVFHNSYIFDNTVAIADEVISKIIFDDIVLYFSKQIDELLLEGKKPAEVEGFISQNTGNHFSASSTLVAIRALDEQIKPKLFESAGLVTWRVGFSAAAISELTAQNIPTKITDTLKDYLHFQTENRDRSDKTDCLPVLFTKGFTSYQADRKHEQELSKKIEPIVSLIENDISFYPLNQVGWNYWNEGDTCYRMRICFDEMRTNLNKEENQKCYSLCLSERPLFTKFAAFDPRLNAKDVEYIIKIDPSQNITIQRIDYRIAAQISVETEGFLYLDRGKDLRLAFPDSPIEGLIASHIDHKKSCPHIRLELHLGLPLSTPNLPVVPKGYQLIRLS